MNAVEIEEAISKLAEQPFDADEFPFAFLEAFGNKATTLKRLRTGASNKSDLGGVLQTNNIHIVVCPKGAVTQTLAAIKASATTTKAKAKFALATDGIDLEAEDLNSGETIACVYEKFPDHFGFFLPLAGISTVKQIRESAFDIKATGRLNRLYIELLKDNPEWGNAERRHEMNHFMARLIFLFFAEDTDILNGNDLFTATIDQMSERDSSNTHEVIGTLFRAMDIPPQDRASANLPRWANAFPYVNGHLFSGSVDVPRFSKIARSYLLHIGNLDWTKINPDIFGSMIQAVADDEERGALGMHYTNGENILKVLNPLFVDDLRKKLEESVDNPRKLLNLRKRMSRIRVFDPACGSGNFLVFAYKEMRAIEAEINRRRGEPDRRTDIPLTNFRGIELRDFPAEIARLALIIAEYQCDVTYRGQKEALAEFLPLDAQNWITCGNALRLDWLSICPPTGTGVKHHADDLFMSPVDQAEIDFENEGGETYICGNPPYVGATNKPPKGASEETKQRMREEAARRKADLASVFEGRLKSWKSLDYVAGWFMKAVDFGLQTPSVAAFVTTNSICQGQQVPAFWSSVFSRGYEICFAHTSFKWNNLASHNAGVTVAIVAISNNPRSEKTLYSINSDGEPWSQQSNFINAYLVSGPNVIVKKAAKPLNGLEVLERGNGPVDGGGLIFSPAERRQIQCDDDPITKYLYPFIGSTEFIDGNQRFCAWIQDQELSTVEHSKVAQDRFEVVRKFRLKSDKDATRKLASKPHSFSEKRQPTLDTLLLVPKVSSESRGLVPAGLYPAGTVASDNAFAIHRGSPWSVAVVSSKLHFIWIVSICGQLETRLRYSNTLGWNTFPVPKLTEKNKADLTRCAEDILLAREAHFPATIADLYDPEKMPDDLRAAHDRNDETLERIYIGRRFRNDTERLEKLFELYTKMTKKGAA